MSGITLSRKQYLELASRCLDQKLISRDHDDGTLYSVSVYDHDKEISRHEISLCTESDDLARSRLIDIIGEITIEFYHKLPTDVVITMTRDFDGHKVHQTHY